jgi:hypothetical protein
MKRLLLAALLVGVALCGLFVLRPSPVAGQPAASYAVPEPCPDKNCKDKKACCEATKKTKDDAEVVAELVKILSETKSSDTFVATLLALSQFEDKSPLPVVVRHAARLGLLKGMSKDENPSRAQQLVGAYLSGEMAAECNPELWAGRYCGPAPVYQYGYAAPMSHCCPPPPPPPVRPTCVPSSTWGSTPTCIMSAPVPGTSVTRYAETIPAPKAAPAEAASPYGTSVTSPKNPEANKDR